MKTYIKVKTQFVGSHQWKGCPYEEVAFLREIHRHIFYVTVTAEVVHADRDIEFFVFKRDIDTTIKKMYSDSEEVVANLGNRSCEMICKEIRDYLNKEYGYKTITKIETSEDDENSAIVSYE